MTTEQIKSYADDMLPKLSMGEKLDSFVNTLSGGQKRKL